MVNTSRSHLTVTTLLIVLLLVGRAAEAAAQAGSLLVTVGRVDSQAFPQVTVSISVADEGGAPDALGAADVQIMEDGSQVPTMYTTVKTAQAPDLYAVLAFDLSMSSEALDALKQASRSFLNTMRPRDRAAIVVFYDSASVVREFTNNVEVLATTIDSLTAQGQFTALNEGAFQSLALLDTADSPNKAVVLMVNSRDNTALRSADAVVRKAQAAHTPLYLVGFDRANPGDLQALATATGGQSYAAKSAQAVGDSLLAIGKRLQQGVFDVMFLSGLKADGAGHDLAVRVSYGGREGTAKGRFDATRGSVVVELSGLSQGEQVGGTVTMSVTATAPAPIASVRYLVDDQLLSEVATAPYAADWDTTALPPGSHRLAVTATDRAGNEGQAEVTVSVVPPLAVRAAGAPTELELGKTLQITAEVESLAQVARVDLLVDNVRQASADSPPYQFAVKTDPFPPGYHNVTLRATDNRGREAEASVSVRITAPQISGLAALWLDVKRRLGIGEGIRVRLFDVGLVSAALVAIGCACAGLALAVRSQKRRGRQVYRLEINNLGNVKAAYQLKVDEPMGALKYAFFMNGVWLSPRPEYVEVETIDVEVPAAPAPAEVRPPAAPAPSRARAAATGAPQAAGEAMRTAGSAAGFLGEIGSLLPGSAGSAVRQAARPIQQTQSAASATVLRTQSKAAMVSGIASKAGGATRAVSSPAAAAAPAATVATEGQARSTSAYSVQRRQPAERSRRLVATAEGTWVESPVLQPTQKVVLDLAMAPVSPFRPGHFPFKVLSRAVGQETAPLVMEEGTLEVAGISWLARALPYALFVLFSAGVLAALALMLLSAGALG